MFFFLVKFLIGDYVIVKSFVLESLVGRAGGEGRYKKSGIVGRAFKPLKLKFLQLPLTPSWPHLTHQTEISQKRIHITTYIHTYIHTYNNKT